MTSLRHHTKIIAILLIAFMMCQITPANADQRTDWEGVDPSGTICERNATTVIGSKVIISEGYVELRWSETCKTNWARVVKTTSNPALMHIYLNQQYVGNLYHEGGTSTAWWTKMTNNPYNDQKKVQAQGWITTIHNLGETEFYD